MDAYICTDYCLDAVTATIPNTNSTENHCLGGLVKQYERGKTFEERYNGHCNTDRSYFGEKVLVRLIQLAACHPMHTYHNDNQICYF